MPSQSDKTWPVVAPVGRPAVLGAREKGLGVLDHLADIEELHGVLVHRIVRNALDPRRRWWRWR